MLEVPGRLPLSNGGVQGCNLLPLGLVLSEGRPALGQPSGEWGDSVSIYVLSLEAEMNNSLVMGQDLDPGICFWNKHSKISQNRSISCSDFVAIAMEWATWSLRKYTAKIGG